MAAPLSTRESLRRVFTSRRTACVALQSFYSGIPLGLIWVAIPAWMARAGVDIKTIGLLTLAQTPWTFKFLWSPLMDRYRPPFLGRKRGWAVIAQIGLVVTTMGLAGAALAPSDSHLFLGLPIDWVVVIGVLSLSIAFASTVQDIAVDAYAVEVLHPSEHGVAVGARTALYRIGFYLAGAVAISIAAEISWAMTLAIEAVLYLGAVVIVFFSPEPEAIEASPKTLKAAVWEPLVGLFSQHRAVEIAAFLFLYKFGENLAQALLRPFLVQTGYSDIDIGLWTGMISLVVNAAGAIVGGVLATRIGLGTALWAFGLFQAFGNLGYFILAGMPPSRAAMFAAIGTETFAQALGTAAFGILLLRLTQKRFSATQYALLSSLFALGRVVTGPIAGFLVDAIGWRLFFIVSIVMAGPGFVFLQRFVPFGTREPVFEIEAPTGKAPATRGELVARGVLVGVAGLAFAALAAGTLDALRAYRLNPAAGLPLLDMIAALARPDGVGAWSESLGVALVGIFAGLGAA
ncbi:MAG TPA: MFS transporter, partial [Verrucomicrobiae bacterium]|nr:MFS transporter [Verrucomicrobiae bacterium]